MSGYLKVLLSDSRWETRYVEIADTKLRFWKTKEGKESGAPPVKELDLKRATLCEVAEPNTWAVQPDRNETTYLQAEGEERKNEWMDALRHYNSSGSLSEKVTLKDFEKKLVLGKGSYGKVYMVVKRDTGKRYAMKELSLDKMWQAEITTPLSERSILQDIDHPFIVHLHYSFQEEGSLYMILDLLAGGELFTYMERAAPLEEDTVKFYAAEVALALGYLHSRNVIYRDLKPENVVFDSDGHACLTDFGLAKSDVHEANAVTYCGTNEYLAPELLKGVPHGRAVDWWSLGLMMYEMLFDALPFYDKNPVSMQTKILSEEVTFPNHIQASEDMKDLIRGLLNKNPERRLQTLEAFKAHKCFTHLDFDRLEARRLKAPVEPDPDPAHNFDREFTSEEIVQKEPPSHAVVTLAGYTYERGVSEQEESPSHSPTSAVEPRRPRLSKRGSINGADATSSPVAEAKRTSTSSAAVAPGKPAAPGGFKKMEHHISAKVAPLAARKKLAGGGSFDKTAK
ncbi:rac serine-threonine kinase [Novymonas esmeraldas]|uniref:Rac serine-threonine kinase n=1 Tax=Novymonas esmeraldas TaxID=1808958 RepID=A0AAW0F2D1_9TRYP